MIRRLSWRQRTQWENALQEVITNYLLFPKKGENQDEIPKEGSKRASELNLFRKLRKRPGKVQK
jgi:hypothetical protein